MKISILLPYKENFSPIYAGAVSLFIKDTLKISKHKKITTIFGSTNLKKKFKFRYKNIPLSKFRIQSASKKYVNQFISLEKKNKSNLIEIHNRPNYLKSLISELNNRSYVIYFHNDPLTMKGSKRFDKFFIKELF